MGTAVDTIPNTSLTWPYTLASHYPVFNCYKGVCPVLGGMLQPSQGRGHFSEYHSLAQCTDVIT